MGFSTRRTFPGIDALRNHFYWFGIGATICSTDLPSEDEKLIILNQTIFIS